jgi:hypothetical protein
MLGGIPRNRVDNEPTCAQQGAIAQPHGVERGGDHVEPTATAYLDV